MRNLASIVKINDIQPIPDADAIEVASVKGWHVVIRKGEFTIGDLAIYVEIDSWIPHHLAPFLSKGKEPREYNDVKGERLRTVRLRGQISQGLLLPISVLEGFPVYVGDDVTEHLGIQKWEAPIPVQLSGKMKGSFPSFIPKTDQERVQNIDIKDCYEKSYEVTEKLEGSSMTCYLYQGEFGVCSRNIDLVRNEDNAFWKVAIEQNIEEKIRNFFNNKNAAIQGELVGEGVQGNHYGLNGLQFYVFDIYDIDKGKYFIPKIRQLHMDELGLIHVPCAGIWYFSKENTIDDILKLASEEKSYLNPHKLREGLVFKNMDISHDSFKVINNEYLLKHG